MKNFTELWEYFQSVILYETCSGRGCAHNIKLMFTKIHRGSWFDLFLLTAVYLVQKIRYIYGMDEFKFTVNIIIDVCDIDKAPLTKKDLSDFNVEGFHRRLMQVTIGPSISGAYWYNELRQRLSYMAEKYENTSIYGLGVTLYGQCKNSFEDDNPAPTIEFMKNRVWEVIKDPKSVDIGLEEAKLSDHSCGLRPQSVREPSLGDFSSSGSYMAVSKKDRKKSTFISGDIETICIDNIYVPYAMGYVFIGSNDPVTYCTESPYYSGEFKERSRSMFNDFIKGLISYSKSYGTKKVYFQNLSRFDGILLLRLLIEES